MPTVKLHILGQHTSSFLDLLVAKLARRSDPLLFACLPAAHRSKWGTVLGWPHAHPHQVRVLHHLFLLSLGFCGVFIKVKDALSISKPCISIYLAILDSTNRRRRNSNRWPQKVKETKLLSQYLRFNGFFIST